MSIAVALALAVAATAAIAIGSPGRATAETGASPPKVVVVVGPVGSLTDEWKAYGNGLARQARRYGAVVRTVYSPNATWARVREVSRGADLFIYLGHGNGWPSAYAPFQPYTKNGLGLNASRSSGDHNVVYKGEYYLRKGLRLAPGAVVLLHHLCYASGNPEWGGPTPTLSTARARADNYANGFLRAGARAVIAQGLGRAGYVLRGLFKSDRTLGQIFWSAPDASGRHTDRYDPKRSPWWAKAVLDPYRPGDYYRSAVGRLSVKATAWR
jgi:hypothetical protein